MAEKKIYPEEIEDQPFPPKEISKEVSGSFFNTVSKFFHGIFKFSAKGGIQIGEIKEGVSGKILLDINGLHAYDSDGNELTRLYTDGLSLMGLSSVKFYGIEGISEFYSGYMGISGDDFIISSGIPSKNLHLHSTKDLILKLAESNHFLYIKDFEDNNLLIINEATGKVTFAGDLAIGVNFTVDYETGDTYIAGDLTVVGTIDGTVAEALHALEADHADSADWADYSGYAENVVKSLVSEALIDLYDDDRIIVSYVDEGNIKFYATGGTSKTAIVPTSKGFRALYCMESPDVWFMDFCKGFKRRKWPKFWQTEWIISPSKLFMETISPPIIVMETLQKGVVQIWGKRKGYRNMRFAKKTKEEFIKNNKFWSTPQVKHEKK